jgi:hypothetical protein
VTPCAPRKRAFGLSTAGQCLLATTIALLIGFGCDPSPPHAEDRAFLALDGESVKAPAGTRYRVQGITAPTIATAQCIAELDVGTLAKRRLQVLLDVGAPLLVGTGKVDNKGRTLAALYVDVAKLIAANELAWPPAVSDICRAKTP